MVGAHAVFLGTVTLPQRPQPSAPNLFYLPSVYAYYAYHAVAEVKLVDAKTHQLVATSTESSLGRVEAEHVANPRSEHRHVMVAIDEVANRMLEVMEDLAKHNVAVREAQ